MAERASNHRVNVVDEDQVDAELKPTCVVGLFRTFTSKEPPRG